MQRFRQLSASALAIGLVVFPITSNAQAAAQLNIVFVLDGLKMDETKVVRAESIWRHGHRLSTGFR